MSLLQHASQPAYAHQQTLVQVVSDCQAGDIAAEGRKYSENQGRTQEFCCICVVPTRQFMVQGAVLVYERQHPAQDIVLHLHPGALAWGHPCYRVTPYVLAVSPVYQ